MSSNSSSNKSKSAKLTSENKQTETCLTPETSTLGSKTANIDEVFSKVQKNFGSSEEAENNIDKQGSLRNLLDDLSRYPLRQYLNLDKGFNIQCRPNYYESDDEEEIINRPDEDEIGKKRRHSFTGCLKQDQPVVNEKIKRRRHSERLAVRGSNIEDSVEEAFDDVPGKIDEDSVCVTRTVTYSTKKKVLKFYQREYFQLSDMDSAKESNEAKELPSANGVIEQSSYAQKELQKFYKNLQNQKLENKQNTSKVQSGFLGQLGLKSHPEKETEKITQILESGDKVNKIDQRGSKCLEKNDGEPSKSANIKDKLTFDNFVKPSTSNSVTNGGKYDKGKSFKVAIKNVSLPKSKGADVKNVSFMSRKSKTHPSKLESSQTKTFKKTNGIQLPNTPRKPIKSTKQSELSGEKLDISQKRAPTYFEIIKKAQINVQNSQLSKNMAKPSSSELKIQIKKIDASQKKESTNIGIAANQKSLTPTENSKEPEARNSILSTKKNHPSSEKSKLNNSGGKRKHYNIDEVERKLKYLHGDVQTNSVVKEINLETMKSKIEAKILVKSTENGTEPTKVGTLTDQKSNVTGKDKRAGTGSGNAPRTKKNYPSSSEKSKVDNSSGEKQKHYDIDEMERKLKCLYTGLQTNKETKLETAGAKCTRNGKDTDSSKYCVLHQKRSKGELQKAKHKDLQKAEKELDQNKNEESKETENENAPKDIKTMKEKREALYKIKLALKKTLCSQNNCPKSFSKSSSKKSEHKATITGKDKSNRKHHRERLSKKQEETPKNLEMEDHQVINNEENVDMAETIPEIDRTIENNPPPTENLPELINNLNEIQPVMDNENIQLNDGVVEEINAEEITCTLKPEENLETQNNEIGTNIQESAPPLLQKESLSENLPEEKVLIPEKREPLSSDDAAVVVSDNKEEIPVLLPDTASDETVKMHGIQTVGTCCCCSPIEDKKPTNGWKFLFDENVIIDITEDEKPDLSVVKKLNLFPDVIVLDDDDEEQATSSVVETNDANFTSALHKREVLNKLSNILSTSGVTMAKFPQPIRIDAMDSSDSCFKEENKLVEGLEECQNLIGDQAKPIGTDSDGQEPEGVKRTSSDNKTVEGHATSDMTEMEHYKKRLIHQHEKPDPLPSPYATTEEEEDDSPLVSPLSPASSGHSRDSGGSKVTGPKVARKRAVCRSQFRHQNMELFKLGSSIPTSLCKTREPYNVCAEKNLQRCFQNGTPKKRPNSPSSSKGSLTESIISTMEGSKKKEVPLWRSLSLNSDSSHSQSNGRHVLPAIVPELPDRRKNRVKSLPDTNGMEKATSPTKKSSQITYELTEQSRQAPNRVQVNKEPDNSMEIENEEPSSSESDVPMNLSMKNREGPVEQRNLVVFNNEKKNERNNAPYLSCVIPKQPNNVPKKPNLSQTAPAVDNDGCVVYTIPQDALDPQKQNNVIVINFPRLHEQLSRMQGKTQAAEQTQQEVLDSAIASLVNIVKSSVEATFNVSSLPVLNNLFIDLSRHLVMPGVSTTMKAYIEEALDMLVSYLLANLFRAPHTPKFRDFVRKLLQLDLRPHMPFLIDLLEYIRNKIKHDSFMDSILKILSRNPQEDPLSYRNAIGEILRGYPPINQYFVPLGVTANPYFRENFAAAFQRQHGGVNPLEAMAVAPQIPSQKRQQHPRHPDLSLMMRSEGLEGSNLAPMRPDLYLADNRCIPPNIPHIYRDQMMPNPPKEPRTPVRRPKTSRSNKTPPKSVKGPAPALFLPDERAIYRDMNRKAGENFGDPSALHRERRMGEIVQSPKKVLRSNSNIDATVQNGPFGNGLRPVDQSMAKGSLMPPKKLGDGRNPSLREQIPLEIQRNHRVPINPKAGNYFVNQMATYVPNTASNTNNKVPVTSPNRIVKNTVIVTNEIPKEVNEEPKIRTSPKKIQPVTKNVPAGGTFTKQCATSDFEQFLQTNIIVNSQQKRQTSDKTCDKSDSSMNVTNPTSDGPSHSVMSPCGPDIVSSTVPITEERNVASNETQSEEQTVQNETNEEVREVMSGTVIIKDNSMEISKGDSTTLVKEEKVILPTGSMDMDDVVLERVSPSASARNDISFTSSDVRGASDEANKDVVNGQERAVLETDMSIEKVTDKSKISPNLVPVSILKRKIIQKENAQKKVKWTESHKDDIVIIDDDEKDKPNHDQTEIVDKTTSPVKTPTKTHHENVHPNRTDIKKPIIEDISSDEEEIAPFRLYSTYESKIVGDPRKILKNTEVSHCNLIPGSVGAVETSNPHMFEKPPVYTRPITPRNLGAHVEMWPEKEGLTKLVRFNENEEEGRLTCSIKVKDNSELHYPRSMDVSRYSPVIPSYYREMESPNPEHLGLVPPPPAVVQLSPIARRSPVVQMSPTVVRSPVVQIPPVRPAEHRTPPKAAPPRMASPVDESKLNWTNWFAEEQKRGIFNFDRFQTPESVAAPTKTHFMDRRNSMGSDCGTPYSPDELFYEIKIDSKVCKIKKSLYEKIPKGKLCYIRESNTFVRYFDDKQMELFLSNLNVEGNAVADNLLKQVKGKTESPPSDVETFVGQHGTSGKGEVIVLSKDVVFSPHDHLSDPELYIDEIEKVQRFVPKDFYGFYKFVTGYQIINHHTPISFVTFLTMHNTNGIRGLFKNYVNTLIEGRNIL